MSTACASHSACSAPVLRPSMPLPRRTRPTEKAKSLFSDLKTDACATRNNIQAGGIMTQSRLQSETSRTKP